MSIKSLTLGWCMAVIMLSLVCWSQQSDNSPSETYQHSIERTSSGLTSGGITSGLPARG